MLSYIYLLLHSPISIYFSVLIYIDAVVAFSCLYFLVFTSVVHFGSFTLCNLLFSKVKGVIVIHIISILSHLGYASGN